LLHFSGEALKSKVDLSKLKSGHIMEALTLVHENAIPVSRMIAYMFLRSKWKIKLFTRPYANWFLWGLTPTRQAEIILLFVAFARYEDFTTSIRLIAAMKITTPKNLSPDEKGS
jgi:hypothetical protein